MMNNIKNYNKPFKITENVWNNVFCFDETKNPTIHLANLISINIEDFKSNIDKYLKLWQKIVFREKKTINNKNIENSNSYSSLKNNIKIIKYKWLQNFIEIKWKNQTIYIFDNHNHALYFRYKEYFHWNIQKWSNLIHIDQHTDMNNNKYFITSKTKQSITPETIFKFTNNNCNVWNFIKPAIEEWLIWNITQINTEYCLLNIIESTNSNSHYQKSIFTNINKILDIDLDFRAPEMSITNYRKTIEITKKLIQKSRLVTIATSPYFLNQNLAIKIIEDLLK